MTTAQMGSYFDLLQDKYGSPYFTDAEKTVFLQRAHVGFVKDLLWPDGKEEDGLIELNQDTISQIAPLIIPIAYQNMNSSGYVTKSSLATALNTASSGALVWRPLTIGWVAGNTSRKVSYVRHNDWWAFQENYFKAPSSENPKVRETAVNYEFLPINTSAKLYFTFLKYPAKVVLDTATPANDVQSDLPDFTHDKIVALALEYAGVSSRDEALQQLLQIKSK